MTIAGEHGRCRTPDALPPLSRGRHRDPASGACLMEYVSVLSGAGEFTDDPDCTHPALAALARLVNDRITGDPARSRLALLAPGLIGTGSADHRITPLIASVCLQAASTAARESRSRWLRGRVARVQAQVAAMVLSPGWTLEGALHLVEAFQLGWREVRRWPEAARDRWLTDLLCDATEQTRRLLRAPAPELSAAR